MAVRAVHEAQMHSAQGRGSCFVTFTFDDAHLPADRSLSVPFVQRFHYRLRQLIGPFRFLLSGEYGERDQRPHYHAIYFGHDFAQDRYPWKRSAGGLLYRSPTLESAWPYGHCLLADFTLGTGRYTAGYAVKKAAGDEDETRYSRVNPETGEVYQVAREFLLASLRPGLGAEWFKAFKSDVFPADFLVVEGRRVPVPRYYLKLLAKDEAASAEAVRLDRKAGSLAARVAWQDPRDNLARMTREEREAYRERHRVAAPFLSGDNGDSRLLVKHELAELRAKLLVRELDAES